MNDEVIKESEEQGSTNKKVRARNILPFVAVVVLALAAFGTFQYFSSKASPNEEVAPPTGFDSGEQVQNGEPNYTIEEVPFDIADIAPSVNRGIQFSDSVPQEVRVMLENQATGIRARLSEDIARADDWFNLAIIYHTANDYEGAREVWEFLIQVIPESTTAYDNLGNLYHFSLKDFPKSESYFNQSIAIDMNNTNAYLGLFELYRYSYKTEGAAAADILNRAITQFPDRLDLVLTLGTYHAERGNHTQAREVLEEGLNLARDVGNIDMIAAFGTEIGRIEQKN